MKETEFLFTKQKVKWNTIQLERYCGNSRFSPSRGTGPHKVLMRLHEMRFEFLDTEPIFWKMLHFCLAYQNQISSPTHVQKIQNTLVPTTDKFTTFHIDELWSWNPVFERWSWNVLFELRKRHEQKWPLHSSLDKSPSNNRTSSAFFHNFFTPNKEYKTNWTREMSQCKRKIGFNEFHTTLKQKFGIIGVFECHQKKKKTICDQRKLTCRITQNVTS